MSTQAGDKVRKPCQVCGLQAWKYKCPACSLAYCSVKCYKGHKEQAHHSPVTPSTKPESAIATPPYQLESLPQLRLPNREQPLFSSTISAKPLRPLIDVKWPPEPDRNVFVDPLLRDEPKPLLLNQYELLASSQPLRSMLSLERTDNDNDGQELRAMMTTLRAWPKWKRKEYLSQLLGIKGQLAEGESMSKGQMHQWKTTKQIFENHNDGWYLPFPSIEEGADSDRSRTNEIKSMSATSSKPDGLYITAKQEDIIRRFAECVRSSLETKAAITRGQTGEFEV